MISPTFIEHIVGCVLHLWRIHMHTENEESIIWWWKLYRLLTPSSILAASLIRSISLGSPTLKVFKYFCPLYVTQFGGIVKARRQRLHWETQPELLGAIVKQINQDKGWQKGHCILAQPSAGDPKPYAHEWVDWGVEKRNFSDFLTRELHELFSTKICWWDPNGTYNYIEKV